MYSVLIVEDEHLTRLALTNYLKTRSDVSRVDTADDGVTALKALTKKPTDILFLDINMPEMSGIELLDSLRRAGSPLPVVVFVTAHNDYAIAAFERHAVDYVLKPFSSDRIKRALDFAIQRSSSDRIARLAAAVPDLKEIEQRKPKRIAIKEQGRILMVDPQEILFVEAEGNYVLMHMTNGSYLLRDAISKVEQRLTPHGFIRIHRSVLVNSAAIAEFRPWYTGEYILKLKTGKEFTVTRTFRHNLGTLMREGIGLEGPAQPSGPELSPSRAE